MRHPQSNILISDDVGNPPQIMDEGPNLIVSRADFTVASLCGPCRWMPPEVLDPYYKYDTFDSDSESDEFSNYISPFTKQSDAYSLGMTVLDVLTGKAPYHHRVGPTNNITDDNSVIPTPRPRHARRHPQRPKHARHWRGRTRTNLRDLQRRVSEGGLLRVRDAHIFTLDLFPLSPQFQRNADKSMLKEAPSTMSLATRLISKSSLIIPHVHQLKSRMKTYPFW